MQHHLRDGYELVPFIFVTRDQRIGGENSLRTVGAHLLVAAIVEKNHIATSNPPADFSFDLRRGRGIPVIPSDIPHHGFEAEFAGDAKNRGTAAAKGRTK